MAVFSLPKLLKLKRLLDYKVVMRRCRLKAHQRKFSRNRKTKAANIKRDRSYGLNFMANLSYGDFKRMFRISREKFQELQNGLAHYLIVDSIQGCRSSGSEISITTKIACVLRFLAGGSYLDISALFGVDAHNFFNPQHGFLWRTLHAIDNSMFIGFSLKPESLTEDEIRFSKFSHGNLRGCVLAVDGWVCKTRCPQRKECGGTVCNYRNRKGCWGIVCLAGCDSKLRFKLFDANHSGSTNDTICWQNCKLKKILDDNMLPYPFYFIGDEAFQCTNSFLVNWGGHNVGVWKDSFNFHLNVMRQCIKTLARPARCNC
jgi:hypothetical protein